MKKLYLLIIIITPFILRSQCTEGEYEILLETTTGEWAEEMSWQILNNQGNELLSFQGQNNDQEYSDIICLPAGCYAVNASDSYGDGWNGSLLEISSNDDVDFEFIETDDAFISNESLFISPEKAPQTGHPAHPWLFEGSFLDTCLNIGALGTIFCEFGAMLKEF